MNNKFRLKQQEPAYDHPDSCNYFKPGAEKPLVATTGAVEKIDRDTILACLAVLQKTASEHNGIDYLQVFEDEDGQQLWFIEDGEGGAITAMLPEDY